jgi:hypothetical protein
MRQVETFTLILLLAFSLFGGGRSVCRDFMDMDEYPVEIVGASQDFQDRDDCQETCRFGQDESLAVCKQIQPQIFSHTVAVSVLHLIPSLSPHLHLLHETTSRLEVHGKLPTGELYLRNASFLI